MSDDRGTEAEVLDLIQRAAEQYEAYQEVTRIAALVEDLDGADQGALVIDTHAHPVGLVLHTQR